MSTPTNNRNKSILAAFSGQQSFITIPKAYYSLTKCLNKAYLLNQIVYYSDKSTYCQDNWFYKSYQEWGEELSLCERTLRNYFKEMVAEGWIEMRIKKVKCIRTPFFRPMMENILESIEKTLQEESDNHANMNQLDQSLTQSELLNSCPTRQNLPDSQTAKSAVGEKDTIYTKKNSNKRSCRFTKIDDKSRTLSTDYKKDTRFMRFYEAFDKKEKPHDAFRAFKKQIGDDDELLNRVIEDVKERNKRHTQWQDRKYKPLAATYLNGRQWDGEIYDEQANKSKTISVEKKKLTPPRPEVLYTRYCGDFKIKEQFNQLQEGEVLLPISKWIELCYEKSIDDYFRETSQEFDPK